MAEIAEADVELVMIALQRVAIARYCETMQLDVLSIRAEVARHMVQLVISGQRDPAELAQSATRFLDNRR